MLLQQAHTLGHQVFGVFLRRLGGGGFHQQPRQNGEGRIQPRAALVELLLEEGAVVLPGGGEDHLVLRLVGLDDHLPRCFAPACAASHLGQQLKGALPGAVVGQVQRHVRSHHAHQRHLGKVQPLGDHLRSHQDAGATGAELVQQLLVSVLAGGGVNVHAHDAHMGEKLAQLLLHLLGTRAEIADVLAAALRAGGGRRLHITAVVAMELPIPAGNMVGHGYIAVGAFHHMAAAAAGNEGVVPPAVHQQHGLLAAAHTVLQRGHQLAGEYRAIALLQLLPHIDDLHLRQGAVHHAGGHFQQGVVTPARHGKGQDAGRGAGQEQRGALVIAAPAGHLPGIVAGVTVGKVGGLVFLVHHDQPQLLRRGKHRRPGADDHPRVATPDAPPLVEAFPSGQPGVQHRSHRAEAPAEPVHHLGREGDLRHQDHGRLAHAQGLPHEADEHLRFAAAGDAVEQEPPLPLGQLRQHFPQHLLLGWSQRRVRRGGKLRIAAGAAQHFLLQDLHQSGLLQLPERLQRVANHHFQLADGVWNAVPQDVQQPLALLGLALLENSLVHILFGNGQPHNGLLLHLHPAAPHFCRQHEAQGLRQGAMGIVCHALGQVQQAGQNGRIVLQGRKDALQLFRRNIGGIAKAHHHAFLAAGAEGNLHPLPHGKRHALRHTVGEGMRHILVNDVHNDLRQHPSTS